MKFDFKTYIYTTLHVNTGCHRQIDNERSEQVMRKNLPKEAFLKIEQTEILELGWD